jgi:hypothetical protein
MQSIIPVCFVYMGQTLGVMHMGRICCFFFQNIWIAIYIQKEIMNKIEILLRFKVSMNGVIRGDLPLNGTYHKCVLRLEVR